MTSLLHDQTIGTIPTPVVDANTPTIGSVTSTPSGNINSQTFLQESVFTGMQFNVPLPFGAVNGFQPMFAIRVDPLTHTPNFVQDADTFTFLNTLTADRNMRNTLTIPQFQQIPARLYNGTTMRITGPEPPISCITKMYRFCRADMVYNIRIVSTYTGGGILLVVPVKGIPRGTSPMQIGGLNQITANGMLVNSNLQCDLSKSRQLRFVYPYEYPTEYWDISENLAKSIEYDASSNSDNRARFSQFENWFVVGTRGNIISPTNAESLTFYVDYAFGQYSLHTPILPCVDAFYPSMSIWSNGTSSAYYEFTEDDFADTNTNATDGVLLLNNTGTTYVGQSNLFGFITSISIPNNTTYIIVGGESVLLITGGTVPQEATDIEQHLLATSHSDLVFTRNSSVVTISTVLGSPTNVPSSRDALIMTVA